MQHSPNDAHFQATKVPWNKGKIIGAIPPLPTEHVWSIRTRFQMEGKTRDLALFNLVIDSKLRGETLLRAGSPLIGPESVNARPDIP